MDSTVAPTNRPDFFRLPKSGGKDPHFSLSRSFYYEAEKSGLLRLRRIRQKGCARGIVLVPFDEVNALIRKDAERP